MWVHVSSFLMSATRFGTPGDGVRNRHHRAGKGQKIQPSSFNWVPLGVSAWLAMHKIEDTFCEKVYKLCRRVVSCQLGGLLQELCRKVLCCCRLLKCGWSCNNQSGGWQRRPTHIQRRDTDTVLGLNVVNCPRLVKVQTEKSCCAPAMWRKNKLSHICSDLELDCCCTMLNLRAWEAATKGAYRRRPTGDFLKTQSMFCMSMFKMGIDWRPQ